MKLIGHAHLHRLHFSDKHTGIVDVQASSMGFMCLNPITFFPVYPGSYWHDFVFCFVFLYRRKAPRVHLQLCIQDAVRLPVLPVWTCANLSCSIIHPGPCNVNGVFLRFLVWMVRLRASGVGEGGLQLTPTPPHVSTGLGTMLFGVSGSWDDREVTSLPEEFPKEPDSEKETYGRNSLDQSREKLYHIVIFFILVRSL